MPNKPKTQSDFSIPSVWEYPAKPMQEPPKENWEEEFADFYWERNKYKNRELGFKSWKSFICQLLAKQKAEIINHIGMVTDTLAAEEMLQAMKDNQPTSRLTSFMVKFSKELETLKAD